MARIVVLGAGLAGSAFCMPLADQGHEVSLVGTPVDRQIIEALAQRRFSSAARGAPAAVGDAAAP